jgi:hypothetical protein
VGVIIFKHFPDDPCAFVIRPVVQQAFSQHGVENASLNGLEAIADVGEGTAYDD